MMRKFINRTHTNSICKGGSFDLEEQSNFPINHFEVRLLLSEVVLRVGPYLQIHEGQTR